ncbi:MAG: fasciclin domain-containing protein [Pseudomonadota bacterium]
MEPEAQTIADIALATPDLSILVTALDAAGLVGVVADPSADFTVFAPTNAAFAALAADLGYTGDPADEDAVFAAIAGALSALAEDGDPIPLLTEILLYHVAPGAQNVDALIAAPSITTATTAGTPLIPSDAGIIDADPEAGNPAFVEGLTDIEADNGTVQVIDGVLLPFDLDSPTPESTIADIVAASGTGFDDNNGDFDMLLAAVSAAGLVDALADPTADFTVFAPTDAAFIALAQALGSTATTEEAAFGDIVATLTALDPNGDPIPLLTEILLYHVIDGSFSRVALADGPALTSLATVTDGAGPVTDGDSLTDLSPGIADPLFIDAASDIVAANGIVQAIDGVLLPLDVGAIDSGSDDIIEVGDDTTEVDGGAGTDTAVFAAPLAAAAIDYTENGFVVTLDDQVVTLTNVETFQFSDATLTADTSDLAAAVFRLYSAGLGRDADAAGASFWTGVAASEGLGVVSDAFINSDEFADLFGDAPTHSEYVQALYGTVLGRTADDAGLAFWTGVLAQDDRDPSDLLLAFSESDEFISSTSDTTDEGVLVFA